MVSGVHAGFSLVVTVVVYPALADTTTERWTTTHGHHTRRITYVVVPVYALVLLGCGVALTSDPSAAAVVAVVLNGAAMAVTAVRAGPLHGRPGIGPGSTELSALLLADRVRTACAVAALVAAAVAATG